MRFATLLLLLWVSPLWALDNIRVAVAANFKATLEQINQAFTASTGIGVTLSSASTGILANQITHGAPFDVFFAADQATPQTLIANAPESNARTYCYARGSLVLAGGDLLSLARPELSLAIANPATAPYGRAAMEVLAREEFKSGSPRKLVRGSNALQAYQYWYSGSVDLALIPRAIAPADATPIPLTWHQPLEQHLLVLQSSPSVDAYLQWIRSDTVRSLISQAGYEPCP